MKHPDFSRATVSQLYEIACNDEEAPMIYKQMAAEEIVRRKKKKRKPYRIQRHKIRAALPRW